jgi:hypothetical protein
VVSHVGDAALVLYGISEGSKCPSPTLKKIGQNGPGVWAAEDLCFFYVDGLEELKGAFVPVTDRYS